jgi:hypothetical protein
VRAKVRLCIAVVLLVLGLAVGLAPAFTSALRNPIGLTVAAVLAGALLAGAMTVQLGFTRGRELVKVAAGFIGFVGAVYGLFAGAK